MEGLHFQQRRKVCSRTLDVAQSERVVLFWRERGDRYDLQAIHQKRRERRPSPRGKN